MYDACPGAFGGDGFIEAEVRRLVGKWAVRTIVETGTFKGQTTRALAGMGADVVTIEIEPVPGEVWHLGNVRQYAGDSGQLLGDLLPILWDGPFLFYLDAHWREHSPLLDELAGIAGAKLKEPAVIVIHDFFNPGHPEYGFDTWDIGEYRLELVLGALDEIYGKGGWGHTYNGEAGGLKRGVIYVEPVK